jgi:hypothetical protein
MVKKDNYFNVLIIELCVRLNLFFQANEILEFGALN